ncbi:MAG: class I SAM-dependent methyltransferase [Fimbriimonas sp.]
MRSEATDHYASGYEENRLAQGAGRLEFLRTCDLLARHLPPAPVRIADVGGGTGPYSFWLAERGYEVSLSDFMPLHIERAREIGAQATPLAGYDVADARALPYPDGSMDAVMVMGPLYHLTDRADRLQALSEARRILRPGGILVAAAISRFASAIDGVYAGFDADPEFRQIVDADLIDGQHRNPNHRPHYFTTTFFHHPHELAEEVTAAGFSGAEVCCVEGPFWHSPHLDAILADDARRDFLLTTLRKLEREPTLVGATAHLLAVAHTLE